MIGITSKYSHSYNSNVVINHRNRRKEKKNIKWESLLIINLLRKACSWYMVSCIFMLPVIKEKSMVRDGNEIFFVM